MTIYLGSLADYIALFSMGVTVAITYKILKFVLKIDEKMTFIEAATNAHEITYKIVIENQEEIIRDLKLKIEGLTINQGEVKKWN